MSGRDLSTGINVNSEKLYNIRGVGPKISEQLNHLGIYGQADLLTYFPRKYEDRSKTSSLQEAIQNSEQFHLVRVRIIGYDIIPMRSKPLLKIIASDAVLKLVLICYNRAYLRDKLKQDEEYFIYGQFQYRYGEVQASRFDVFEIDKIKESLNFGRIVPIYRLSEAITQNTFRKLMFELLQSLSLSESLPSFLIEKYQCLARTESLFQIHFPDSMLMLEKAQFRLKYFELLNLCLHVALKRYHFSYTRTNEYKQLKNPLWKKLSDSLDFKLTQSQISAFASIRSHLYGTKSMHRILQGDVGSGKTIVALLTMLIPIENGYQALLMAPTEILARQHYERFKNYLKSFSIKVEFFVGSLKTSERTRALKRIQSGEVKLIIGTHALYSEAIKYANLSLVVIDEQHKFGVQGRIHLVEKGKHVDVLVMTATPIPRTLALSIYGDLDISTLDEKPNMSVSIKSKAVLSNKERKEAYQFIDSQIEQGRQAFIVCPSIQESEQIKMMSVEQIYDELTSKLLKHRRVAKLYGRQSADEKQSLMNQFVRGDIDVLVSTSLIEVGMDVANASCMLVENADRFGLAQLHQMRGRIGRGKHTSYCFFVALNNLSERTQERLDALIKYSDGFELSEQDLKIRGPGEILGLQQSGFNKLKIADLFRDEAILKLARQDAFQMVQGDPTLSAEKHNTPAIRNIYRKFEKENRCYLSN